MSEHVFKFSGQTYPGFQAHETGSITAQPIKNPNQQPISLVIGEGFAAATAGIVIGIVASKIIARKSMSVIPLRKRQRAQG